MRWISKGKKKKYSLKRLIFGFGYAGRGIFSAFKSEQNFTIEIVFAIMAIIMGFVLKISMVEFAIIVLTIAVVLSFELVNTAIEYTVDMAMPEIHPLAKVAKDVSAGAVLVSAITSIIIGLIIFLPKLLVLF